MHGGRLLLEKLINKPLKKSPPPHLFYETQRFISVRNSPPLVPIMSQMHPVHNSPYYFPNIHTNTVLPSTPWSSECIFPSDFPTNTYTIVISSIRATCPVHPILLNFLLEPHKKMFTCTLSVSLPTTGFHKNPVCGTTVSKQTIVSHEADHSPPSSAVVKTARSYTSTSPNVFKARCSSKGSSWCGT
jgi:hypothetical protein